MTIQTVLVDRSNFEQAIPQIVSEIQSTPFNGLDCETQDDNRHEGLNNYCGYDPKTRKKPKTKPLVFDMRRTVMTGFSVYPEGRDTTYYLNLNHADVENRIPWPAAEAIIKALPSDGFWIAHNASYELTAFKSCYGIDLPRIICTMQMAVSHHGPDNYDVQDFINAGRGSFAQLMPDLIRLSVKGGFDIEKGEIVDSELADLVYSIIAKESRSAHSYNGFVNEIAYSYSLKKLVKMLFGHNMTTFEQVLGDKAHMGQLTGPETAAYGGDDAYWAVLLFRKLMERMAVDCPEAIPTFFSQENPMVRLFSDMWFSGLRINTQAVYDRRDAEREELAQVLRDLKPPINSLLPFSPALHEGLEKRDDWYRKNHSKYRQQVIDFANSPDNPDAFEQVSQVRGPVTNAWRDERGLRESKGINLSHYMPVRTLIYDLTGAKSIVSDGKTQSDGEARGKLKDRATDPNEIKMLEQLGKIAGIEQRMKLYLTPYTRLMDPETGRMYPVVSSMLATRRMAASTPNPMQLAKRGESTYVRGFFQGDKVEAPSIVHGINAGDEHLVMSCDWSGIELVLIGEQSGDPEFIKAFGQIPHEDLHSGAAADILSADVHGLTEPAFKDLKKLEKEIWFLKYDGTIDNTDRLFTNLKGEPMDSKGAYKFWRTEVGKGANFNYWFSGWLATIGERMGWSPEKTKEATERYRARFSVAEQWRVDLIDEVHRNGYVILPDGHRRERYEATDDWLVQFKAKFDFGNSADLANYNALVNWIARKIQKRAFNQAVNAKIQGSCATMAKRTAIRIMNSLEERGWDHRVMRFMMPVHDELVYSVHPKFALEGIKLVRGTMIDHPDLFQKCLVDASPSIGVTFEPWHEKKAPFGQIELFEAPKLPGVLPEDTEGTRLSDDHVLAVIDYLSHQKALIAA